MCESDVPLKVKEEKFLGTKNTQLRNEIEGLVRKEVEVQLAKEQKIIKDSLGIALKIVGGAIALFLAIFTLFGLSTWRDIKNETAQIVQAQAELLVNKADSDTGVKATLNNILNLTVVNSYLARHSRSSFSELELAHNDWNRLREWIKQEDLSLQEFSDTLSVLNLQADDRKRSDANRVLSELLNPPEESQLSWIRKQPEKIEAILSSFKHKSLGSSALSLVTSKSLTDAIRSKAALYIKEVYYREGVDGLLSAYNHLPWGDTKQQALISSFELRPDRDDVINAVKQIITSDPTSERIDTISSLILVIPYLNTSGDNSPNKEEIHQLHFDLLEYGITNGLYFTVRYPRINQLASSVRRLNSKDAEPRISLMRKTSETSASGAGSFSISEFRELTAYWELLSEAANSGDITKFGVLLLRDDNRPIYSGIELTIIVDGDSGAKFTVKDESGKESELELQKLKQVSTIGIDTISDPLPLIRWQSDSDQIGKGEITGFTGSNFSFSM